MKTLTLYPSGTKAYISDDAVMRVIDNSHMNDDTSVTVVLRNGERLTIKASLEEAKRLL